MRDVMKFYLQPAFLICAVVLATAAGGMSFAVKKFQVNLTKEPLPLKKSLELLDENGLPGYTVVKKVKIKNKDILEQLGTREYIQWTLDDISAPVDSPLRRCFVFITYYELPDRVPHVPEECYAGSGHQKTGAENLSLLINRGTVKDRLEARQLTFSRTNQNLWQFQGRFSVLYIFNVNGVYVNSRQDARTILNKNIFGKHSYFSKVEWNFLTKSGMRVCPQKEQAVSASEKLLSVILPLLEKEHWPDFDKLNQ